MTKLNEIQRTYLLASEAAKVAHIAAETDLSPFMHLLETEEGIEKFCEIEAEVDQKHDIRFFDSAKLEAEKALLAWSFEAVKKTPQYRNDAKTRETVDLVISKSYMPTIRPKLIEQALRLDPKA